MAPAEKKIDHGSDFFRPKARLLHLLGEQLIANEIIAVVELIKNSYDAGALNVQIIIDDLVDEKNKKDNPNAKIIVKDDGCGMDLDTILHVWLEPGTDYRILEKQKELSDQKEKQKNNIVPSLEEEKKRIKLGEKGIGRFAVHKLGKEVQLITKKQEDAEEIVIYINWADFLNGYLTEIPINWEKRKPETFLNNQHGTSIVIRQLRKRWDKKNIKQLNDRITSLNSIFDDKKDFQIKIEAPGFENILDKAPKLKDILDTAIYKFDGTLDENGILTYNYTFFNSAFENLRRNIPLDNKTQPVEDIKDAKYFENNRNPTCGKFRIRLYVWDLDVATLSETIKRSYYNTYVKSHTGIRIYRDEFRVWPYGEPSDDSLGLDLRRVNNPTQRISRNQVIGIIEISSKNNSELKDKTDREGLVENKEYQDFKSLVISCISNFEAERRFDKDKIDKLREKKKPGDEVHKIIDVLTQKIEKNGHSELYSDDIKKISTAYNKKIKTVLDPLLVTAGLGIAYTLPVHEITRNLNLLNDFVNEIDENTYVEISRQNVKNQLNQIHHLISVTHDMVHGVSKISQKSTSSEFGLDSIIKDAIDITKTRFKNEDIKIEIGQSNEKVRIRGVRNLLVTAVLNIFDNSAYWLLHRPSDRLIKIKIDHDENGKSRLIICDNGPGIKDDPSLLVEPFFSRKPDGSGLGLYIVDRIMKTHDGEIQFLDQISDDELLEGANVALIFPQNREVQQ
jgi:signal transduction histidine kinase/dsDNA-binding SOS-regulon protein